MFAIDHMSSIHLLSVFNTALPVAKSKEALKVRLNQAYVALAQTAHLDGCLVITKGTWWDKTSLSLMYWGFCKIIIGLTWSCGMHLLSNLL